MYQFLSEHFLGLDRRTQFLSEFLRWHFAKKSQNLSKRVMRDLGVLSGVLLFAIVNYIITTLAQIHKLLISRLIICPHCPLHCVHFLSINLLPCYSPRNNMLKIFCVSRLLYFWIPDLESRHATTCHTATCAACEWLVLLFKVLSRIPYDKQRPLKKTISSSFYRL